jgi:glutamine synthetase
LSPPTRVVELLDAHDIHTVHTVGVHLEGIAIGRFVDRSTFERSLPRGRPIPGHELLVDPSGSSWLEAPRDWLVDEPAPRERPALDTLTVLGRGVATVMVDHVGARGRPIPICTRGRLAQLAELAGEGGIDATARFTVEASFEPLAESTGSTTPALGTPTPGPRFRPPADPVALGAELAAEFSRHGVSCTGWHLGRDPGQLVVELAAQPPVRAADDVLATRAALTAAAANLGARVSWSPVDGAGGPGNGLGVALELPIDPAETADVAGGVQVPSSGMRWIAAWLASAGALTAIANPSPGAYRRLGLEGRAPAHAIWGAHSPSALVQSSVVDGDDGSVPRVALAFGAAGGDANPHLTLAALLAAGLGYADDFTAPRDHTGVDGWSLPAGYAPLPASLGAAHARLAADHALRAGLGATLVDTVLVARRQAWLTAHRPTEPDDH